MQLRLPQFPSDDLFLPVSYSKSRAGNAVIACRRWLAVPATGYGRVKWHGMASLGGGGGGAAGRPFDPLLPIPVKVEYLRRST